jgi:hypothetical protein
MRRENIRIIKGLIKLNGKQLSIDKIEEEAVELALSLIQLKCPTKLDKKKRLNDVHKELADMKIMLRQAEMIFSKKKINKYVNQKLSAKNKKYLTNDKGSN